MLEANSFSIQLSKSGLVSPQFFTITDAKTGEPVGFAVERIGVVARGLQLVYGERFFPRVLELREKPDDSLVFILRRRVNPFQPRFEVLDALGALVGSFGSTGRCLIEGFSVLDRNGTEFVSVLRKKSAQDYWFAANDGTELGRLSRPQFNSDSSGEEPLSPSSIFLLHVSKDLVDRPLEKMLLLGAALAIQLVTNRYPGRIMSGER